MLRNDFVLSGPVVGTSNLVGETEVDAQSEGTIVTLSSVSAFLKRLEKVGGLISGVSTVSGGLIADLPLQSSVSVQSGVSTILTRDIDKNGRIRWKKVSDSHAGRSTVEEVLKELRKL